MSVGTPRRTHELFEESTSPAKGATSTSSASSIASRAREWARSRARSWLADGSDRTVTRIEPASRQTTTFDVPGEAQYVVDQESGEVWALSVPEA